ncbi:MAG: ferric iron uptake transcriptional regulator [Gammaproteobacteria bacterium]
MESQDLKKAGLKVTAPRLKILRLLEESVEHHFGAEDIYRKLNENGNEIGLATVYRVLAQFEQAGLVTRHNFEGDRAVYELNDGTHHDHMVCMETGKVIEFVNTDIEALQRSIADAHGYELVDHSFVLFVRPKR